MLANAIMANLRLINTSPNHCTPKAIMYQISVDNQRIVVTKDAD
jgi:hypothetical protein